MHERPAKLAAIEWTAIAIVSVAIVILVFLFLNAEKPQEHKPEVSPELQAFKDKFEGIEEEMTEDEVNAILAGYPSTTVKETTKVAKGPLKRPSTRTKIYKSGAQEGDYVLFVYFDEVGYVVGKDMAPLMK